ncbi:MAG: hypothetical protein JOY66_12685 [Acetobacteraceae bacterium]|nr:hypothetical protein [Acetobacteraceae bacterium]
MKPGGEGAGGAAHVFDGLEDAAVDGLLLQGPEQALDASVRLGLGDEGVARRHASEPDLLLERLGPEVVPVVVSQRQALGRPDQRR